MNMARPGGEHFRSLQEVCQPDPRMENLVVPTSGGGLRQFELADWHAAIDEVQLRDSVPNDVWVHFETARNLALYSWFVYRFQSAGEMQALASLEFALRERFRREGSGLQAKGLKPLFRYAIRARWISAEGLSAFQEIQGRRREFLRSTALPFIDRQGRLPQLDPQIYLEQLVGVLPWLRNTWAHGSGMLLGQSVRILRLCADLINQLFDERKLVSR